jgi:hypothetical protein
MSIIALYIKYRFQKRFFRSKMLSCLRKSEAKIDEGPAQLAQITFDGLCLDEIIIFIPIQAINLTKCREILYIC